MKNKIFIFDMDGVLVDTKNLLYSLYIQFVNSFGKNADSHDCQKLDGFKLAEIITYAKRKYHLLPTEEELSRRYELEIDKAYSQVNLIKNVDKVIQTLKEHGCQLALASSAKRKEIDFVLERFQLKKYFDFIVSGDDVSQAKPSPEIYNRIRGHFGDREYYVIEDSPHGVTAATNAKMRVIFLNQDSKKQHEQAEYIIDKMDQMEAILIEIERECKTVALANFIKIRLLDKKIILTDPDLAVIDSYWERQKEQNHSLFNGKILSYHSYQFKKKTLIITCFITEYKYYLAQLSGLINGNIKPLAVSGIIIDEDNHTLLAKRSDSVTEYKQYYEFVPSGGLSVEDIKENTVQFKERIAKELNEETTISLSDIKEITPLGLTLDHRDNVFDICVTIKIKGNLNQHKDKNCLLKSEYSLPLVIHLEEVEPFFKQKTIVPTSLNIYTMIRNQGSS